MCRMLDDGGGEVVETEEICHRFSFGVLWVGGGEWEERERGEEEEEGWEERKEWEEEEEED